LNEEKDDKRGIKKKETEVRGFVIKLGDFNYGIACNVAKAAVQNGTGTTPGIKKKEKKERQIGK